MMWRKLVPLTLAFLLFVSVSEPLIPPVKAEAEGNISFQPNVVPELSIHFVEEFFRFQWLGNTFDLKLLVAYQDKTELKLLSLRDFAEKDKAIKRHDLIEKATESMYEFGYTIEDIPSGVAVNVEYLLWKVESASFSEDLIETKQIEVVENVTKPYNITRFLLPDNLVLSYEDLYRYNFTVSHPSKLEAKVEGVKGKTSWNLDPITFSSPIITVIGGSEGSPLDCKDIWDADQTGGWGVVHNNNETDVQFQFDAQIVLGNGTVEGTTWFADTNVQVFFSDAHLTGSYQRTILVKNYAHLRLGTLVDATDKITKDGVSLFIKESSSYYGMGINSESGGEIEFYSCAFAFLGPFQYQIVGYNLTVYNSIATAGLHFGGLYNADFYNVEIRDPYQYGMNYPVEGTFDKITVTDATYAFYTYQANQINVSNVVCKSNTYVWRDYKSSVNHYLVNADVDSWAFSWVQSAGSEVYRQYTFDLSVFYGNNTYAEGSNVTISNSYLGTSDSWLIGSNGSIPQQTYSMGHYNQTGGDTIYDYNPYNVTITLSGYTTYTTLLNITEQEDLKITLQPQSEGDIATGFIFGGILTIMIMLVLGLAYFKKPR